VSQAFDPYYKWLGIPPKDQPPNHYRLLGVELFEPDRDVIDAAANRIMVYLKSLAGGEDAEHSQRLLNEVAAARQCLLHPQRKAAYDDQLRAQFDQRRMPPAEQEWPWGEAASGSYPFAAPPPFVFPPPPVTAPPVPPAASPSAPSWPQPLEPISRSSGTHAASHKEANRGGRKANQRGSLLLLGGIAAALVVLLALALTSKRSTPRHPRPTADEKRSEEASPRTRRRPGPQQSLLSLDWPLQDRRDAYVFIDNQRKSLKSEMPIDYALAPGEHELILERDGYHSIKHRFYVEAGGIETFRPQWQRRGSAPAHEPDVRRPEGKPPKKPR